MSNYPISIDEPRSLFATVAFSAIAVLIFNALPVILGVASDTLSLSAGQMGLLASVELGGIGLTSVSGLFWIRRVPWRRAVLLGVLMLVIGNVLSIFAHSPNVLLVLRFLTGLLGEGVVFTVAMAAIGDSRNPDRAFAFSMVGQVGLGMVALWCFPYIALKLGFAGVMGVMAIIAMACLAMLHWLPVGGEKIVAADQPSGAERVATPISIPLIGLFGITCWFVGLSGIWAFVERIGIEATLAQTSIGTLLSIGLGLGALASLIIALVGDRYGRFWPPLAALVLHVISCYLFAGEPTVLLFSILVLSFTFIWNIGLPFLLGLIAESDSAGRLVVLVVSAQAFGNTLGPMLAGQVVESRGLASVGIFSALFCMLALLVFAIFLYRAKSVLVPAPSVIQRTP